MLLGKQDKTRFVDFHCKRADQQPSLSFIHKNHFSNVLPTDYVTRSPGRKACHVRSRAHRTICRFDSLRSSLSKDRNWRWNCQTGPISTSAESQITRSSRVSASVTKQKRALVAFFPFDLSSFFRPVDDPHSKRLPLEKNVVLL